jgi:hypothetical protein
MSEEDARQMFRVMEPYLTDTSFKEFWAQHYSEELKLFWVTNTAAHTKLFLAENAELALHLAAKAGLLRNWRNGNAQQVSGAFLAKNRAFASALAKAIKEGTPGLVERLGDHAKVKGETFAPLHSV